MSTDLLKTIMETGSRTGIPALACVASYRVDPQ